MKHRFPIIPQGLHVKLRDDQPQYLFNSHVSSWEMRFEDRTFDSLKKMDIRFAHDESRLRAAYL